MPSRCASSARGGLSSAATIVLSPRNSSINVTDYVLHPALLHPAPWPFVPIPYSLFLRPLLLPLRLQRPQRELEHPLAHLLHEKRLRHAVARLRVEKQLERLVRLLELVDELHGVGHVDVVVDGAVQEQQLAVQVRG